MWNCNGYRANWIEPIEPMTMIRRRLPNFTRLTCRALKRTIGSRKTTRGSGESLSRSTNDHHSMHFSTPFVTDSALHGGPAQSQSPGHCRFGSHHDRSGNWISTERLGNLELLTTEWVIHSERLSGLVISEGFIPLSSRLRVPHFVFRLDSPSLSDESEKF